MPKKKRHPKQYDLDPALAQRVKALAKQLRVTESQIVQLFITEGLLDVQEEKSSIWGRFKKSESLNYKYNIDIDDLKKKLSIE
jgi:hypothetical protein